MLLSFRSFSLESEAAKELNVSVFTLARERRSGRIPYRKMRGGIRYTAADLASYVNSIMVQTWREPEGESAASKSEASGLASDRTAPPGAGRGSILNHDRRAAHHLAQTTLKPRSSS